MIAGPNGSGKTTLTRYLLQAHRLSLGVYINADDLERTLQTSAEIRLAGFDLKISDAEAKAFFAQHPLNAGGLQNHFQIQNGVLKTTGKADGYFAAVLADFIRQKLLQAKTSFTFETVMSGSDKLTLLKEAHRKGFRNYLYYICTDDVLINRERINSRVLMGEHAVPEDKIVSRYKRSLSLLLEAVKATNRAYLFDNSGPSHELIAEITNGEVIEIKSDSVPAWFVQAVINKL